MILVTATRNQIAERSGGILVCRFHGACGIVTNPNACLP